MHRDFMKIHGYGNVAFPIYKNYDHGYANILLLLLIRFKILE